MMKRGYKEVFAGAFVALALFGATSIALAQQPDLFFGQNHYYTVLFRGNGEAIVFAKLVFTNTGDIPLTEFTFELPRVAAGEMLMFQQKLPQACKRYQYVQTTGQTCAEYTDSDYNNTYYGQGQAQYQKITYKQTGKTYDLTLPFPVDPNKSTAVVISYSAFGYVVPSFGHFAFNFETLKVPSRISQAKVTINVDTDLILKNPETNVNYESGFGAVSDVAALSAPAAIASPALDTVVRNIGNYGQITKTAKQLAANETLTVSGEYATSWFWLYLSSIIWTVVIIALLIILSYFIVRWRARRKMALPSSPQNIPETHGIFGSSPAFLVIISSFLSALLVVIISLLVEYVPKMSAWRSLANEANVMFVLLVVIAVLVLYVLALFGPAVLLGSKRGAKYAVYTIVGIFVWLILFLIIYLILFSGLITSPIYSRPYPVPL